MIILHEYRSGEEFGLMPSDIRYTEVHGPVLMVAHMVPIQVPDQPVQGPRGPQLIPHHVEVFVKTTEVMESIYELQEMLIRLKWQEAGMGPVEAVVVKRCQIAAAAMREANKSFGSGPREEPIVADKS